MKIQQAKMRKLWDGWWILLGDHRLGPYSWADCKKRYDEGIEIGTWLKEQIGDR